MGKIFLTLVIFTLGLYAYAQSSPAAAAVTPTSQAAPVSTNIIEGTKATAPGAQSSPLPTSAGGLIGLGLAIAAAFNGLLSTAQIVLSKLGKAVPTWLPSVQSGLLNLVKFFGMNL
jgi:hypothetical protein